MTGGASHTDVFLNGTGFFIKKHYIVCPASLVLIPPVVLSEYNRYPFVSPIQPAIGATAIIPNTITRVSRILVDVNNVNGCGRSFTYEAQLVGVDGAGDIALLYINRCLPFNFCLPRLRCDHHPYFCFGSSRDARVGEKVYGLGDWATNNIDPYATAGMSLFTEGKLASNRYADYLGWALQELIAVTFNVYGFKTGIPILDSKAKVLGMQTLALRGVTPEGGSFYNPNGVVAGPSERFMRRVLKSFICSADCGADKHSTVQFDAAGNYYVYNKGWLGLAYRIVVGDDLGTVINPTTGLRQVILGSGLGQSGAANAFLDTPECKELVGVRVVTLAGSTATTYVSVPGAGATAPPFPPTGLTNSPLLGSISPGDIITYIRNNPLGDSCRDIVPSVYTWKTTSLKNKTVCLTYRKQSENFENMYSVTTQVLAYPPMFDYPYYNINDWPLIPALGIASLLPNTGFYPTV
jgi:hypothetical protein